ncbi:MAG: hypothetical protein M1820_002312 [Bogoriella megaspora]|nr:MAG: hypothetical protein M1820_002312 [Bogoriella megaspora]
MALLSLPNEVLTEIIAFTRPEGFEEFILSCRNVFSIAKSTKLIEQHNQLVRKWQRWDMPQFREYWDPSLVHPMLPCIVEEPISARYINYLRFPALEHQETNDSVLAVQNQLWEHSLIQGGLLTALQLSPYLRKAGQDPHVWFDKMMSQETRFSYSSIFLLTLLPNVTHLRLSHAWGLGSWGCIFERDKLGPQGLRSIDGQIDSDLRSVLHLLSLQALSSFTNPPGLFKLHTIEPWSSDVGWGTPLQSLTPFMALPSMRKMILTRMEADHNPFRWPYEPSITSPIEVVEATKCAISSTSMSNFLAPMHNLRILKYSHFGFSNGAGYSWDAGSFLATVMSSPARLTIEELSLEAKGRSSASPIKTLKGFSKLRWLERDAVFLTGEPEASSRYSVMRRSYGNGQDSRKRTHRYKPDGIVMKRKLVDVLPPTIRRVRLIITNQIRDFARLFVGLATEREKLPQLQEIEVVTFSSKPGYYSTVMDSQPKTVTLPTSIRRQMNRAGIKYSNPLDGKRSALHTSVPYDYGVGV